jgi:hypothetical protein
MNARRAVLGAVDIDGRTVEMNLLPAKIHKLADPQCMAEGHQDQQPVASRVAAFAGCSDQLVDLGFRQVFALPVIGILAPTAANCRLFRS